MNIGATEQFRIMLLGGWGKFNYHRQKFNMENESAVVTVLLLLLNLLITTFTYFAVWKLIQTGGLRGSKRVGGKNAA
jgi:hypothetical protein